MSKAALNMVTGSETATAWRSRRFAMNTVDPGYMSAAPECEDAYDAIRPIGWEDGAGRVLWTIAVAEPEARVIWGRSLEHYGAVEVDPDSLKEFDGGMNLLNHYALSAVHGYPREKWNGYPNTTGDGYYHHSKDSFSTWHWPYMTAYEIAIYKEMVKVAGLYTNAEQKGSYRRAAARFRLPYWDPLTPRNERRGDVDTAFGLPVIFQQRDIYVRTPSKPDELTPMANPLYEFTFPKDPEWKAHPDRPRVAFPSNFSSLRTIRTPDDKGESDHTFLDK
ncbi:hypothetical protein EK21DRAFT_117886 [Setomelanomma holmii]|uniref:WW domain-containing protein n=1 Tax=Setomelanomma holmii TaxID=210430 RepID=A0A9P4H066_9PLEO|nr:hypothetical protein EK21DRAFT_117886 [Setomelanomma holmii]